MASGGCTTPTTWYGEGTEGNACFPDGTCDSGLECRASVCTRPITTETDGGPRLEHPVGDGRPVPLDLVPPPSEARPCANPPPAPELDPVVANTHHQTAVIRGRAAGAQGVLITGGVDPQSAYVQEGGFCLEVVLSPDATSTLMIVAVDEEGCTSTPVGVKISQSQLVNQQLFAGLRPEVSIEPDLGKNGELVDGKTNKAVSFSFWDVTSACDNFFYMWFDLTDSFIVDSVVVHYPQRPNFTAYLQCWQLLGSTEYFPSAPEPGHPQWFVLAEASNTTESVELTIPIPGVAVRHLALLSFENAAKGYAEIFEFTEIKAFGHEVLPPPETCN